MLEGGRRDLKVVQQGVQDLEIEGGVVGDDEIGGGEVGEDFVGDLTELGLVFDIKPGEFVDVLCPLLNEPAVTGGGLDEPIGGGDELFVFKDGETKRTGTEGTAVGGFEVYGDDFHEESMSEADGALGTGGWGFVGEDFG